MIHRVFSLMTTSKVNFPNNNLEDALKEINSALEGWEKITSKPINEQDVSLGSSENLTENHTKDILNKLREQINELSKD